MANEKYMTVPETIELANSGPMGYPMADQSASDHKYKPMKIPDTITLESSNPTVTGRGVPGSGGGEGGGERDYFSDANRTEGIRQLQPTVEDTSREKLVPKIPSDRIEVPSSPNHEQRIHTLESKVQRLTEMVLQYEQNPPASKAQQGHRFWYVMTFAGWMMVPLIAVFMYQYKKTL